MKTATTSRTPEADAIACLVLEQFDKLPPKRKPTVRDNGTREWVPLSGIVARGGDGSMKCLALATGMKCLPAAKIPAANGSVLHDWHAEVLAIRAFNHFVLEECKRTAVTDEPSRYLRRRSGEEISREEEAWYGQPFAWRDDVTLHMYCSEAPCGDASMELTMAAQEDASPWETPPAAADGSDAGDVSLPGRGFFSQLGIVRRKPARGDAPPTLSKSCSDKIALKQCTSLLSSLTSLLVSPEAAYIRSLVLPESQYSATGCQRAFSPDGRMGPVRGRSWPGGYSFVPFEVRTTAQEFSYSRQSLRPGEKVAASNLAVAWTAHGMEEGLINGVLQGRKQSDPRGASLTSRRAMWTKVLEVASLSGEFSSEAQTLLSSATYDDVKDGELLAGRRRVKSEARQEALNGWLRNSGDSGFSLGVQGNSKQ
ncbi:Adenosine-deaminase domain-containing protein [Pleurostoma richardsiae]|uniref:Adenosine-deaminase domain-containing protein n=1 Tax=Pleurostoma richardsiae TaxID=41990 RepID=A0AA38S3Q5_9PEZI|nr:Adenosine-deaminase domain-containing protein [Pleurostoma richardsiae]